jgi:outer membrane protein assembly factor BamD
MPAAPVPTRRATWRLLPLALALTVLAACTSNGNALSRLAPDSLYERASKSLRSGDYLEAIRVYEALTARYPFTDQARQSRLDIIYAYYKNREKESAIDAAETFIRENPAHPRVDYAWYIKGLRSTVIGMINP